MIARIEAAVDNTGGDWAQRLDTWLSAALADYPTDRALHDVLYHYPLVADHGAGSERPGRARDLVDSLADLVTGGLAAGSFHASDPELTAILLGSALHRVFDRIWHRDEPIEPDRVAGATRQLFRRTLGCLTRESDRLHLRAPPRSDPAESVGRGPARTTRVSACRIAAPAERSRRRTGSC